MSDGSFVISPVESDPGRVVLRSLLREYHQWMASHEDRYDPETELAEDLRSLEMEPESWAWIARADGRPAGCVLLYGETDELAEFKRLWVRPTNRTGGIGRALVRTTIDEARNREYATLALTTPPWSERAQALYESMGFERTPPYPETRLPEKYHDDAIFMQLDLTDGNSSTQS